MDQSHIVGAILASKQMSDQQIKRRNDPKEEDRFYEVHGSTIGLSKAYHQISNWLAKRHC